MGLDSHARAFLKRAKGVGVDFSETLTVGRQTIYGHGPAHPADEYFRGLGAESIESVDRSDYQGATMLWDLNEVRRYGNDCPIGHQEFSAVVDSGTLEHIFQLPVALQTLMTAVKVGGHFITITPTDGYSGHGFYQTSPEFWFRALSFENGYQVELAIAYAGEDRVALIDPKILGRRVTVDFLRPALVAFVAKRVAQVFPFEKHPQQSDYAAKWAALEKSR